MFNYIRWILEWKYIEICVNTYPGVTNNVVSSLLLTTSTDAPTIQVSAVQAMLAMLSFIS